jgi:6-phosphofructokinase 1
MNAAIRAVTRSAPDQGMTVYGVRQGWQGLVDGQFRQLSARDVGGIIQVGGTFLGSARSAEFRVESGQYKALRNLAQRGIDGVVVIGGNGSQTGSYVLSGLGVHVVGIASTIDNDLLGTDISIGCDSAINVTLEAIDHLRTTGSSHNRAFLVETMGRDCGYLAMMAGGAEVISTPEFEVSASEIAQRLRAAYERGKTHAIVVIAEGVKESSTKILGYFDADKQRTGFELRATTLGHVVRGAPPSAFDRLLATRLAVGAVKALSNGETNVLVGWQKNEVTRTPLADIVGRTKPIMRSWSTSRASWQSDHANRLGSEKRSATLSPHLPGRVRGKGANSGAEADVAIARSLTKRTHSGTSGGNNGRVAELTTAHIGNLEAALPSDPLLDPRQALQHVPQSRRR